METQQTTAGVEERLQVGYYFNFAGHPFEHAELLRGERPVHEALQTLPAYLRHFFGRLASPRPDTPDRDEPGYLARRPPPHPSGRLLACIRYHGSEGQGRGQWYTNAEGLRACLESCTRSALADASDHGAALILEPNTHRSAGREATSKGDQPPTVLQLSGLTSRPGGRLWVCEGARLVGCHIDLTQGDVYIGERTVVDPFASICGPTIIGKDCVVRTGARIRGNCVFGDRVVVGGEIKSSILMDEASFPHQCYVGDSICGFRSHFGNGATSANLGIYEGMKEEAQFTPLTLNVPVATKEGRTVDKKVHSGTAKLGIIMGDYCQVGCNSVSDPATFLAPRTVVYALTSIRKGFYGPDEVLKNKPFEAGVIERAPFIPNKL